MARERTLTPVECRPINGHVIQDVKSGGFLSSNFWRTENPINKKAPCVIGPVWVSETFETNLAFLWNKVLNSLG